MPLLFSLLMPRGNLVDCCFCSFSFNAVSNTVTCVECNVHSHYECYEIEYGLCAPTDSWLCASCLTKIFSFNCILNEDRFLDAICDKTTVSNNTIDVNVKQLEVFPIDLDNHSLLNNDDIDPDVNLFADLSWDSTYSTPDSLASVCSPHCFTAMHLNCRSLLHKVADVVDLLTQIPASVMALTETWLIAELTDSINVRGYVFTHKPRATGRGVVL